MVVLDSSGSMGPSFQRILDARVSLGLRGWPDGIDQVSRGSSFASVVPISLGTASHACNARHVAGDGSSRWMWNRPSSPQALPGRSHVAFVFGGKVPCTRIASPFPPRSFSWSRRSRRVEDRDRRGRWTVLLLHPWNTSPSLRPHLGVLDPPHDRVRPAAPRTGKEVGSGSERNTTGCGRPPSHVASGLRRRTPSDRVEGVAPSPLLPCSRSGRRSTMPEMGECDAPDLVAGILARDSRNGTFVRLVLPPFLSP